MDALEQLRKQAAQTRDDAIKAAREEYQRNLKTIAELGLRLGHRVKTTRGTPAKRIIADLIVDYMPKDRPFSLRDVVAILRKACPGRQFQEATIRTTFQRLIDENRVRKVRKADHGFMLWAAPECPIEDDGPMATMSLPDAAAHVLRERGPMRPVEIVLAVQELGYRADGNRRTMLVGLSQALKRHSGRFSLGVDGRWSTV
jgi:hypothetical protein